MDPKEFARAHEAWLRHPDDENDDIPSVCEFCDEVPVVFFIDKEFYCCASCAEETIAMINKDNPEDPATKELV